MNNFFLSISFIFHFIFAEISLTACPVLAKTWLFHTLRSLVFLVVVSVKIYQNFPLKNFHLAKLIEHWHLRPNGARLMWMRRVRRLCLRPWYWRMTLLFWFQKIPKTKVSHVTLRVLGGRPPSASLFSEFGVGAPNGQRIITVWLFARKKCWSQNCRDRIR